MKNDAETRESIIERTTGALREVESRAAIFVFGDPCPLCRGTDMLMLGGRDSAPCWCRACGSVIFDDGAFAIPQCSTDVLAGAIREAMHAAPATTGKADMGEQEYRERELDADGKPTGRWLRKRLLG